MNEYLSDKTHVLTLLAQMAFSFFEISGRVYDDIKLDNYHRMVEFMTVAGPRVWSVLAFRFWDVNLDGSICSKDIFKMYQQLD